MAEDARLITRERHHQDVAEGARNGGERGPAVDIRIRVERLLRHRAGEQRRRVLLELVDLLFERTDPLEVLLEPRLVRAAEHALEARRLLYHAVEDALSQRQFRIRHRHRPRHDEAIDEDTLEQRRR